MVRDSIANRPSKSHPWGLVIVTERHGQPVVQHIVGWLRTKKAACETACTIVGATDDTGHPIGDIGIARWGTYYRNGKLRGA